jgi:hypothetical protein
VFSKLWEYGNEETEPEQGPDVVVVTFIEAAAEEFPAASFATIATA